MSCTDSIDRGGRACSAGLLAIPDSDVPEIEEQIEIQLDELFLLQSDLEVSLDRFFAAREDFQALSQLSIPTE